MTLMIKTGVGDHVLFPIFAIPFGASCFFGGIYGGESNNNYKCEVSYECLEPMYGNC